MTRDSFLKVSSLYKSFTGKKVLEDVSLEFESGKISVIIGQSGSGKSVLVKSIIGIMQPDSGDIVYKGRSIFEMEQEDVLEYRREFGYLFQESALFDSMTVFENVAFPLVEVQKIKDRAIIERTVKEKLEWVGLPKTGNLFPSELSGGMKKRIALARALANKPQILLFDEPTTGLDPVLSESINELISRVNNELGLTCIVISHDIPAAFRIAHHIALLHDTRICFSGTSRQAVFSNSPIMKRFIEFSFNSTDVYGEKNEQIY